MSSNQAHPSNSSPVPHYSFHNTDPSLIPYPIVPKPLRDGTMGQGRPCDICGKVIAIGAAGSLYAYNSHFESCQKKQARSATRQLDRAASLPVVPSVTTVPNGIHRSVSLSPLIVGAHLHTALSPTPSPASSPTSLHQPALFDSGLGSNIYPSTSIQVNSTLLFDDPNPMILINPPSDDSPSLTIALYPPQSYQTAPVMCPGIVVEWTPGTIWETYPFPSHSLVKHPWDIIEFCSLSRLRLRSKACAAPVGRGGYGHTCSHCLAIPHCGPYKKFESRANNAPPHTPHGLLSFNQLAAIPKTLRKMLDEARLKVFD